MCGSIYHPGVDINHPTKLGNADMGEPISSVANGRVVSIGCNWAGLVVRHKTAQNEIVFVVYGHIQNISSGLHVGDVVKKGQQLAEVGRVGAALAHLHFEIRKAIHPKAFCDVAYCRAVDLFEGRYILKDKVLIKQFYYQPEQFVIAQSSDK